MDKYLDWGGGDLVANDFPETTRNQHKAYI